MLCSCSTVHESLDESPSFYESRAAVQNENENERFLSVYINTLKTEPHQQNI